MGQKYMTQEHQGIIYKLLNILCIVLVGLVSKTLMQGLSTFQGFFFSCLASGIIVSMIIRFGRKKSLMIVLSGINKNFLCIAMVNFTGFCTFLYALKSYGSNIFECLLLVYRLLGIFIHQVLQVITRRFNQRQYKQSLFNYMQV